MKRNHLRPLTRIRRNSAPLTATLSAVLLFAVALVCGCHQEKRGAVVVSASPSGAVKASAQAITKPSASPTPGRLTIIETPPIVAPVVKTRAFYDAEERESNRLHLDAVNGIRSIAASEKAQTDREARAKRERENAAEIARLKRVEEAARAQMTAAQGQVRSVQAKRRQIEAGK